MKKKFNILIIEDNLILQDALCELFTEAEHNVWVASSADEANEQFNSSIHILVIDINLPGENGLSISKRFRESCPFIGIVLLTARNQNQDILKGYEHGADNYFTKPFNPDILLSAVENLGQRILSKSLTNDYIVLNPKEMELTKNKIKLSLSTNEVTLLTSLNIAPEKQLETWQIMEVFNMDVESKKDKHKLEMLISRLRKRIHEKFHLDNSIKSIRGLGYQLSNTFLLKADI